MRSFFTSSLDKIDPPAPYVNALDWQAYRAQFRKKQSGTSGNRDCMLASRSLNPESPELSHGARRNEISWIILNTLGSENLVEHSFVANQLVASSVDQCFSGASLSFLEEKRSGPKFSFTRECFAESKDDSFDLELGLLESVQELAIALARTTPKRTGTKSETNELSSR